MKKKAFALALILLATWFGDEAGSVEPSPGEEGWVTMPSGGKPAYMGIQGGTMPVSLLVSGDGSSLLTFVGRTGNDFLEVLRRANTPLPSFGNSTSPRRDSLSLTPANTGLFAGNATASLPVFALSGDVLAKQAWFDSLAPFGFSSRPLSIEGQAAKPDITTLRKKRYKIFFPDALKLRH